LQACGGRRRGGGGGGDVNADGQKVRTQINKSKTQRGEISRWHTEDHTRVKPRVVVAGHLNDGVVAKEDEAAMIPFLDFGAHGCSRVASSALHGALSAHKEEQQDGRERERCKQGGGSATREGGWWAISWPPFSLNNPFHPRPRDEVHRKQNAWRSAHPRLSRARVHFLSLLPPFSSLSPAS
jgi:hypothetical protein